MTAAAALAAFRSWIVFQIRLLFRTLVSAVLAFIILFVVLAMVMEHGPEEPHAQTILAILVILLSTIMIFVLVQARSPDWKSWLGAHAGVVAGAAMAVNWVPQWSGIIAVTLFVLLVTAPGLSYSRAQRRDHALSRRVVRFYAGLACVLHPSRFMRFQTSLLVTDTLGSIAAKLAAHRALAVRMPERSAQVQCWMAMDQDDWEGALAPLRGVAGMKHYEIRALGELRRFDEMIATYAATESILPPNELLVCRLFILAFCGRPDAVRALLRDRQLRSLAARHRAFWIFVATRAAGADDAEAQRVLVAHTRAAADETFHRRVQRHLSAPPLPNGALSAASHATLTRIVESLWGS